MLNMGIKSNLFSDHDDFDKLLKLLILTYKFDTLTANKVIFLLHTSKFNPITC